MGAMEQLPTSFLHSLTGDIEHAASSCMSMMTTPIGQEAQPLHAVVVPWPGQGHLNPLFHLSKRLASEFGFSITFVNIDYIHSLIQNSLQHSQDAPDDDEHTQLDIKFVSLPDGLAESMRASSVPELCRGVLHSAPAFERLLADLRPPPTCVISDIFVLHTQDAANKLGIPRVGFWTQSVACFAAHLVAARGQLPFDCFDDEGTLITNVVGAPPLRYKDLPGFTQKNITSDFMFEFATQPFTRLEETMCVLMNTFKAMEGEAMELMQKHVPGCNFYTIGPVLPVDYFGDMMLSKSVAVNRTLGFWSEDDSCLKWLDTQPVASVLYVSFGSIAEFSNQELHEFALGLEATSFPILWVLRPNTLKSGEHVSLPSGFLERTHRQVFIVDWAPQLQVLAHPSIGAFFTHAGWNSILEGISQGKPLLGFPYFADQMLNCRCIEDLWRNGLDIDRYGEGLMLTRSLVENKVRALMSDPKLRKVALMLRDGARQAILTKDQGSSSASLTEFVMKLRMSTKQYA